MDKRERAANVIASLENEMRHGRISRRDFLKRTSGILLWAGVGGSLLSGCGQAPAPSTAEPTKPPEATKPPEPAALEGEIVWVAQETTSRDEHFEDFPESIKLTRVVYTDQPAVLQQLRVGSMEADAIQINPMHAGWAREYDLIQPIDTNRLANWHKVLPGFAEMSMLRNDKGELDVMPQFWGTDAIAYNADEVTEEEASTWAILWSDKFAGKTAMRNNAQEGLALIGLYLGAENIWNQTTEELAASLDFLKKVKSKFRTFWNSLADVEALFLNGEVVAAHTWFPIVKQLNDAGMNIKWKHPKEGAIGFIEGQSIAKGTEGNKLDLAYALLDYILSDEYYKSFYDGTGYRYCTDTQFDYLPPETIEYLGLGGIDELISTLHMWELTPNLEEYQEVWTEFLAS